MHACQVRHEPRYSAAVRPNTPGKPQREPPSAPAARLAPMPTAVAQVLVSPSSEPAPWAATSCAQVKGELLLCCYSLTVAWASEPDPS